MLADHIAVEIHHRWVELDQLPSLQRLKNLESIIERHILATGGTPTYSHLPDFEEYSDLVLEQSSRQVGEQDGK